MGFHRLCRRAWCSGSNRIVPHQPRTYETQEVEGVTSFKTYDQRLVTGCEASDTNLSCLNINVGTYHNDLWEYPLGTCCAVAIEVVAGCGLFTPSPACTVTAVLARALRTRSGGFADCVRYDDYGCADEGWRIMRGDAALGGCQIVNAVEFCTHPSERYLHGSAMFHDGFVALMGDDVVITFV